jgi:RNA polymerase sigma factor (sigma-70 family)
MQALGVSFAADWRSDRESGVWTTGGYRAGFPIGRRAAIRNDSQTGDSSMTNFVAGTIAQRRFHDIVPPLLDDAYTLAKWICRNGADAEDIVQEAAIRALKALETTAIERPKPWFLTIVRNAAISWMAKNRPKDLTYAGDAADLDAIDPRLGEAAPDPEAALIAFEDGERLRRAIADLQSPLLETLIMRDVNGLSYRDIAEATGAPMGTVMSRLARARASLMKTLKAEP